MLMTSELCLVMVICLVVVIKATEAVVVTMEAVDSSHLGLLCRLVLMITITLILIQRPTPRYK